MMNVDDFMQILLEAGFDRQMVLQKGYDYSYHKIPEMVAAAERVRDAAKKLKIDAISQSERERRELNASQWWEEWKARND